MQRCYIMDSFDKLVWDKLKSYRANFANISPFLQQSRIYFMVGCSYDNYLSERCMVRIDEGKKNFYPVRNTDILLSVQTNFVKASLI